MNPATLALLGAMLLAVTPVPVSRSRLRWLVAHRLGDALPGSLGSRAPSDIQPRTGSAAWGRAGRRALLSAAVVGAGSVLAFRIGPVPAALAAIVAWTILAAVRTLRRERSAESEQADLERAVGALVDEYTAGATTAAALSSAASSAGVFRPALSRAGALTAAGSEPEQAMPPMTGLIPLRVACATVSRTGAPLSEVLRGVQLDLAADRATGRAVRAAVAGPRASAVLLTGLPLVGLAMGQAIGAHPARTLLHTPVGLAALCLGVCLNLAGLRWTLALTRVRH